MSFFFTAPDDADSLSQFSVRSGQTRGASLAKDQTPGASLAMDQPLGGKEQTPIASLAKNQIDSRLLESARMIRSTVIDPLKATQIARRTICGKSTSETAMFWTSKCRPLRFFTTTALTLAEISVLFSGTETML